MSDAPSVMDLEAFREEYPDWLESASGPGAFLDLPHRWPGRKKAS